MRTLAATCIERPVFAAMIVLALVVVGAASFFRLGVDRFPAVDLPTVMVRTNSARRLGGRDGDAGLRSSRRSDQSGRGHHRAALDLGPRPVAGGHHLRPQSRHRFRRTGRARPRGLGGAPAARRHRAAAHPEAEQRAVGHDGGGAVGQPVDPRADRDRRQDGEGRARTLDRRRRGADRRRARAGHEHVGRGRPPRRLSPADRRGAKRAAAAERRRARRQRHHRPVGALAAHHGPLHRPPRSSTSWSSPPRNGAAHPRARHRLRRRRHQGAALAGAPERRAHGGARAAPPVGRQHGGGDRGCQGQPRPAAGRSCRRASRWRSCAIRRRTSTPRCTRSTCTSCSAASSPAWWCSRSCATGAPR